MENGPLLIGDRPLPHSIDMERAVLCCLLTYPEELSLEFDRLRPDDFYVPAHRRIFDALMKLHADEKPIDIMTVSDKLVKMDAFEDIGGYDTLRTIGYAVPSMANFNEYLIEVQNAGRARRLIGVCSDVSGKLFEPDSDVNQIISTAESEIIKVSNEGTVRNIHYVRDCVPGAVEKIEGIYSKDPDSLGIPSGFQCIDEMLTGFQPGKTYIIAARPSIGKTTFALNLAAYMSFNNKGAFFSLEMTETECTEKLISLFGGIDLNDVYAESIEYEELRRLIDVARQKLDSLDLIIDDKSYYFEDLVHQIKLLYVKFGIKFVAIDYLQLITMMGRTDNREQMISKMSSELKKLAKLLNIPIIILAQLNRGAEGRAPLLSDLRDSGAIEQDADVVALLHRERTDTKEQREKVEEGQALETMLIMAKNRGGKTGPVNLWFFPQWSQFQQPERRYKDSDIPE